MKVTVVIPNYNGKHFMEPCLKSLEKQTFRDFQTVVVDNASSDGSIEYMKEHYPEIKVIAFNKNYGFSKAVNAGIQYADTPYVILLNNDTAADPYYIEEMVKAVEKSDRIFSVSCKLIQMYHPDKIDSAGDMYTVLGWAFCRGGDLNKSKYDSPCQVFTACAAAAIYRREVFSKIGYFDVEHFAYLEDVDVGYRAKIYGYQNWYCPTALVYHVGSGTSGSKYNAFKVKLSARNSIYLNYKNMPFLQEVVNFIPLVGGIFVKYLFFRKKGFGKEYLEGLKEGWASRKHRRKVPFRMHRLWNYLKIEWELLLNTGLYVKQQIEKRK